MFGVYDAFYYDAAYFVNAETCHISVSYKWPTLLVCTLDT